MTFEEALKAMKEGKRVKCPTLSSNTFFLKLLTKKFYVYDGLSYMPLYFFKDKYILSNDWEIAE